MIAVNGTEISESAVLAEIQYHPAATRDAAFAEAAEALVVRELLLQRAAALGLEWTLDDPASEERAIDELLKRELKLPIASAADYRRYYENNRAKFQSRDLFEASHILYLAPQDDAPVRLGARAAAERALATLKEAPERFAEIAKAESRCASAGEGGRLGQVARGETAPEIDTFLAALEDGQLCPVPIETDYGVHILKLERRIPGHRFEFEEVQGCIAAELARVSEHRAVGGYIALLAASARIQGVALRTATSALVQ